MKNQESLTQKAYKNIKQMMFNYEIIPGQRLVLVDLSRRLGVSRTPINNALSILTSEGFLDFIPNQGYRVHEITKDEAESLYEIREILELGCIESTINRQTSQKIKILEKNKRSYEKAVAYQVSRERFALDEEFHASYVEMAGNVYLPAYFREIYQRIFLRHRIEGLRLDRTREVVEEHDQILHAIKKRDVKKARKSIINHIRAGKEYIIPVLFG